MMLDPNIGNTRRMIKNLCLIAKLGLKLRNMKRNRILIIGQLAMVLLLGSCNSDDDALELPVV